MSVDDLDIGAVLKVDPDLKARSLDDVFEIVREHYGLKNVLYFCASLEGTSLRTPFIKTTYSDSWQARYAEQDYISVDPVFHSAAKAITPIDWSRLPREGKRVSEFFDESYSAGVGQQGLTVPIRGPISGVWALFTLTSDESDIAWESRRYELIRDMVQVAHYVHQTAFEENADAPAIDLNAITRRELDALKYAAEGRSNTEISRAMRISEATVKCHLDSARYKLQALNRLHAVSRAMRSGLLR